MKLFRRWRESETNRLPDSARVRAFHTNWTTCSRGASSRIPETGPRLASCCNTRSSPKCSTLPASHRSFFKSRTSKIVRSICFHPSNHLLISPLTVIVSYSYAFLLIRVELLLYRFSLSPPDRLSLSAVLWIFIFVAHTHTPFPIVSEGSAHFSSVVVAILIFSMTTYTNGSLWFSYCKLL